MKIEVPSGIDTNELKKLLNIAQENKRYFDRKPKPVVMLVLDLKKSGLLQQRFKEHQISYDRFFSVLREGWDKVARYYQGIFVKDIGDERVLVFGLKESKETLPEKLAAGCALDLHKFTENATFLFLVNEISILKKINKTKVYKFLTTILTDWKSQNERCDWKEVNQEYDIIEKKINTIFQLKIAIANGVGTPTTKEGGVERDIDGEPIIVASRLYNNAESRETLITPNVLKFLDESFHTVKKGEIQFKEFSGEVYNVTGLRRYNTRDLYGLAPKGSKFYKQIDKFKALTDNSIRFLEEYQSGEKIDPITNVLETYEKQNLILDNEIFEKGSIYYSDDSLLACTVSYAIADAMIKQGVLKEKDYTARTKDYSLEENLGLAALLANLGLWQSNEKVSGSFINSPRTLSERKVERFNLLKARHGAIEIEQCPPLERRGIGLFVRFQHAKYDGTGLTAKMFKAGGIPKQSSYARGELKGKNIPIINRILKVAKAYVGYRSDRCSNLRLRFADKIDPYKLALITLKHLKKSSGKRFDPKVISALDYLLHTSK